MKAEFATSLKGEWIDDKNFKLLDKLVYVSKILDTSIVVNEGFITDFASVPRVPIVYNLFGNRAHHESVIHDWLFFTGKVNRKLADKIFLEAMECRKKSFFIRYPMYWGVRLGGWAAWNNYRKADHLSVPKL